MARGTNVRINIGLGFANRQQMTIPVTQLLELLTGAKAEGLADPHGMYNGLKEWIEASGIGTIQRFSVDPSQDGWQPPPPAA